MAMLCSLEESQLIAVRPEFWRPTSRSMMSAVAAGVSRPLRAPGVVRTGAGGELFWSRWAGWRGRVDRAGAAGAGSAQLKKRWREHSECGAVWRSRSWRGGRARADR